MLTLPIKKKWFDMILSGEKKEEYRDRSPYYETRLVKLFDDKKERLIMFRNGYSKSSPSFVAKCSLSIGTGKEEWGAEKDKQYFVLTIHEILR